MNLQVSSDEQAYFLNYHVWPTVCHVVPQNESTTSPKIISIFTYNFTNFQGLHLRKQWIIDGREVHHNHLKGLRLEHDVRRI